MALLVCCPHDHTRLYGSCVRAEVPRRQWDVVSSVFPGTSPEGMLVVPTCQQAGMDLVARGERVEQEKDRLLERVGGARPYFFCSGCCCCCCGGAGGWRRRREDFAAVSVALALVLCAGSLSTAGCGGCCHFWWRRCGRGAGEALAGGAVWSGRCADAPPSTLLLLLSLLRSHQLQPCLPSLCSLSSLRWQ